VPTIPQDFIEQVRSSSDIVNVVSSYVPLKPSGKSFKGLCPFHNEKTPSFHVNPDRQIFHCFGCNEGGDAFKFLMLYDKLSFVEAVEQLAGRAGLALPRRSGPPDPKERDRTVLLKVYAEASKFYQSQLNDTPEGARAIAYLEKRGFTRETIRDHGIGLAPDQWSALLEHLTRRGARPEQIEHAGFVIPRKNGRGFYDRFRNRVMVPIASESGQTIAFGGRMLGDGEPKYLNSPESPVYNKSAVLYGFHHARDSIRREGHAILMEGYMDCLQAYQAGVHQAVACCGTSLTAGHARLLRRYTDCVLLNFDPDDAGMRAARRSIDLLLEEGFDIKVLTLPDGLDPDSFIRARGADAYRALIPEAGSFVRFLIQEASKRYDVGTPRGKAAFLNDVLPLIGKIPNRVERIGYVGPLAEYAAITDGAVLDELERHVETKAQRFKLPVVEASPVKLAERELIRWILSSPEDSAILDELEEEDLEGLATAPILRMMKEQKKTDELSSEALLDRLSPDALRTQMTRILSEPSPLGPRQSARDCLNGLRKERWKRKLSRLRAKLASGADDDNLTAEILSLARRIETLGKIETRA